MTQPPGCTLAPVMLTARDVRLLLVNAAGEHSRWTWPDEPWYRELCAYAVRLGVSIPRSLRRFA